MKKLIEYLLFYIFVVVFLAILVLFDILQRLAVPFGQKVVDKVVQYFNLSLIQALRIVGCRLKIIGEVKLPEKGPAIIISNHQSMFDIPAIHSVFKNIRPRFISKKELGKGIPGVSTCLRVSHAALIDRSDANQALAEIQKFSSFLKDNEVSGVIFPEGTRARDGALKQFKKRGIDTLITHTAPCWIIPLTIDGSWRLQNRKFGPIPWGVEIRMNVGEPIFVSDPNSFKGIGEEIYAQIGRNLTEMRTT